MIVTAATVALQNGGKCRKGAATSRQCLPDEAVEAQGGAGVNNLTDEEGNGEEQRDAETGKRISHKPKDPEG